MGQPPYKSTRRLLILGSHCHLNRGRLKMVGIGNPNPIPPQSRLPGELNGTYGSYSYPPQGKGDELIGRSAAANNELRRKRLLS